jgi:6-phosphogluconolactonase
MAKTKRKTSAKVRNPFPDYRAYTGCFTEERRHGHGNGINVYAVNGKTGAWTHLQTQGDVVNPSWLLTNKAETVLYALNGDQTYISSFRIDRATGRLSPLNRVETGGKNGVVAKLDARERFMVLANYSSGHVTVLRVAPDGAPGEVVQHLPLTGKLRPRHRIRQQESSHPHDIFFDSTGKFIVIPDKGLDRVWTFRWDGETGRVAHVDPPSVQARDGAAPRHGAFHPKLPVAWVTNEMDSSLTTYRWDRKRGVLTTKEIVSTLPADFTDDSSTAEIQFHAPSRTLYVSNRGLDKITLYRVDAKTGAVKLLGWQSCFGREPRYFGIDPNGQFLYCANARTDTIVRFRIDQKTGKLSKVGQPIPSLSSVTIAFTATA